MPKQRGVNWRGPLRGASTAPLGLTLTGVVLLLLLMPPPMWAQAGAGSGSAQVQPTPVQAPLSLGERADLYMVRRNFQAVIILLEPALKQHPKDAALYNRLGIAYQQLGNLGDAERNYKKAIKYDRKKARYPNNLGTIYFMQRNFGKAAKEFSAAIKLDATDATFFINLGGAEFARKRVKQAVEAYRRALAIDPTSLFPQGGAGPVMQDIPAGDLPEYHYTLARLFCGMGMIDDALHQFRQAYELKYPELKKSLTDPAFAPLRLRAEYRLLMGLPPLETGASPSSAAPPQTRKRA